MSNLMQTLRDNWAVIAQAPWAFLVVTVLLAGTIWLVVKALKAEQVGSLEARLKLRDDEIADYKRKLDGASPQQAHDRIEALERRIGQLEADPLAALRDESGAVLFDGGTAADQVKTDVGSRNTVIGTMPSSMGSGNTFVDFTDANGNTILKPGTSIGAGAGFDPTSVIIGADAGANIGKKPKDGESR
jgi:hypothetical protein